MVKPQAWQMVAHLLNLLLADADYRAARVSHDSQDLRAPRRLADGDASGDCRVMQNGLDHVSPSARCLVDWRARCGLNGKQPVAPVTG